MGLIPCLNRLDDTASHFIKIPSHVNIVRCCVMDFPRSSRSRVQTRNTMHLPRMSASAGKHLFNMSSFASHWPPSMCSAAPSIMADLDRKRSNGSNGSTASCNGYARSVLFAAVNSRVSVTPLARRASMWPKDCDDMRWLGAIMTWTTFRTLSPTFTS